MSMLDSLCLTHHVVFASPMGSSDLRNQEMDKYVSLLGEVSQGERGLGFPLTVFILIETGLSFKKYILIIFK